MHQIEYLTYHCSTTEKQILKQLNEFAFDPQETSGYHGNIHFHKDIICKNREEAMEKVEEMSRFAYDDHAVFFKDGRKKYWLARVEWHC